MAVHKANPYWYGKDYTPPLYPKKKKYGGKKRRPLTKEEKEAKAKTETAFPWEMK